MKDLNIDYKVGVGEAAFYGPKLDIQIKNVHGKEDTLVTIQIDQMLAEKILVWNTLIKTVLRKIRILFTGHQSVVTKEHFALLIEKYAGAFPVWLAPVQIKLCLLRTDIWIMYMKLRNSLRQTVFCVRS